MSAFNMVFSAAIIFRFPSTHLMMYLGYSANEFIIKLIRRFSFSACELLPFVLDILNMVS